MSNAKAITLTDFEEMKKTTNVYLLDFWAPWCGPCKVMNPILDELAEDADLKDVNFVKINVDEEIEFAGQFGVRSIPTFYLIKFNGDGTFEMERDAIGIIRGAKEKQEFKDALISGLSKTK